jgi:hypothetical protein
VSAASAGGAGLLWDARVFEPAEALKVFGERRVQDNLSLVDVLPDGFHNDPDGSLKCCHGIAWQGLMGLGPEMQISAAALANEGEGPFEVVVDNRVCPQDRNASLLRQLFKAVSEERDLIRFGNRLVVDADFRRRMATISATMPHIAIVPRQLPNM